MGYLGEETGKLGFGLMRLPHKDNAIDIEQTKEEAYAQFDTSLKQTGAG